jgi:hypothetical protein
MSRRKQARPSRATLEDELVQAALRISPRLANFAAATSRKSQQKRRVPAGRPGARRPRPGGRGGRDPAIVGTTPSVHPSAAAGQPPAPRYALLSITSSRFAHVNKCGRIVKSRATCYSHPGPSLLHNSARSVFCRSSHCDKPAVA